MTDALRLELDRTFAMSSAWDSAHEALTRRDTQAFDKAMTRFREVCKQQPREPGAANNRPGRNS